MIFAQIYQYKVINTIIIDDLSLVHLFLIDPTTQIAYDSVLEIDHLDPQPGIGWTFYGNTFSPPEPEVD